MKLKCIFMSRYQNAGYNHSIKKAKNSFQNVAYLKYLTTTVTNEK